MDPQRLPRQTIAEIGRLAVIARYRNRRDEDKSPAPLNDESFGTKERPRFPYLTVGLYLATIELARLHNIATLFVLTGPCARRRFPRWQSRPCSASWRRSRRGVFNRPSAWHYFLRRAPARQYYALYELLARRVRRSVT